MQKVYITDTLRVKIDPLLDQLALASQGSSPGWVCPPSADGLPRASCPVRPLRSARLPAWPLAAARPRPGAGLDPLVLDLPKSANPEGLRDLFGVRVDSPCFTQKLHGCDRVTKHLFIELGQFERAIGVGVAQSTLADLEPLAQSRPEPRPGGSACLSKHAGQLFQLGRSERAQILPGLADGFLDQSRGELLFFGEQCPGAFRRGERRRECRRCVCRLISRSLASAQSRRSKALRWLSGASR